MDASNLRLLHLKKRLLTGFRAVQSCCRFQVAQKMWFKVHFKFKKISVKPASDLLSIYKTVGARKSRVQSRFKILLLLDLARGASPGRKERRKRCQNVGYSQRKCSNFRKLSQIAVLIPLTDTEIVTPPPCVCYFWDDIIHTKPGMQRLGEFRHPQSCFLTLAGEL